MPAKRRRSTRQAPAPKLAPYHERFATKDSPRMGLVGIPVIRICPHTSQVCGAVVTMGDKDGFHHCRNAEDV